MADAAEANTWAERGAYWTRTAPQGESQNDEPNQILIETASIEVGFSTLDIASGAGEPAISIALAVGESGSVTCFDANPEMLQGARNRAENMGIKHMNFEIGDMVELPFADGSFDAVTCRFGIMFPKDPVAALTEVKRVLKSGRKAAYMTHGPPADNTMSVTLREAVRAYFGDTGEDQSQRRFNHSGDGELADLFRQAGLNEVGTRKIVKPQIRPAEGRFWETLLLRTGGQRLEGMPEADLEDLNQTIREAFAPFLNGDKYEMTSAEQLAWGSA